ncbi:MAG: DUF4156 domain-containing protein [Burkholderiales bacterium]
MHAPKRVSNFFRLFALAGTALLAGGCAMVELTQAGAGVRFAGAETVSSCKPLGKVTANVMDKVAFVPRDADAVADNLKVTARNAAADMGADTIVPASKVEEGKQTFEAYRCLRN